LAAEEVHSGFDPRREAVARYYIYQISQRRTAFAKRFVWWVKDSLDHASMQQASQSLIGRHDFSRFCEKRADERSTIVVVTKVQFRSDGDLLLFRIGASHFLWKMVRRVIGGLVEVGRGSISAGEFSNLLESGGRSRYSRPFDVAAHTAPPSGLFLERVAYRKNETPGELGPVFPVGKWSTRQ
jgi:tRNA pseudouridine38-40 synthase